MDLKKFAKDKLLRIETKKLKENKQALIALNEKREDLIEDEIIIESENSLVSATDDDIYQKIKDAYDKALSDE